MRNVLKLGKRYDLLFLIISSFIFFLLRLPSLFEPHWYGDEGIYQVIGEALNRGSLLYRDIWDNKPPLLYLIYALFDSDQFTLRLVSFIFGLCSIFVFFLLAKSIFGETRKSEKIYFFATSIYVLLLGLPLIEGNIANAENFMMLPILIAAFLIFNFFQRLSTHSIFDKVKSSAKGGSKVNPSADGQSSKFNTQLLIVGLLLGIAFLFKVVAIFDFLAFLSFLLIINLPHKLKSRLREKEHFLSLSKKAIPLIVGFFIPVLVTVFYFSIQGVFIDFIRATFSSNISYVGWQNKLILPLGLLLLKTALLIIAIMFIVGKRRSLSPSAVFILLWFFLSLYNAFFAQRPYTHYLLAVLPSFSLMIGLILWEKKHQKAIVLFFILAFLLILKNFNLYGKTIAYYHNFFSFITGVKSISSYRAFFDKRTPIDYEIATFLKGKVEENDSIFIWGNNAQVYKLVGVTPPGKYILAYHIENDKDGVNNMKEVIERIKPKFIIVMPNQKSIPFQLVYYSERIIIDDVLVYERFL